LIRAQQEVLRQVATLHMIDGSSFLGLALLYVRDWQTHSAQSADSKLNLLFRLHFLHPSRPCRVEFSPSV
jgi:hypothetical protein